MEVGSWKLEVGSGKPEARSWKWEVGSRKLEDGSLKIGDFEKHEARDSIYRLKVKMLRATIQRGSFLHKHNAYLL